MDDLYRTLNPEQRSVADAVIDTIEGRSRQKLFFVDGPGGSGKTYFEDVLYKKLQVLPKKVQWNPL